MSNINIKFNNSIEADFFKTLRKRVNAHFKENNITKYANGQMRFKTAFMIALYFVPFILLLTGFASSFSVSLIFWALMGLGMAGVGLSIMHDANHGSYSKKKWVNTTLKNIIIFIGGYAPNWSIQHNVLHHSFTNVDGYDEDINAAVLRMCPNQERKSMHRFQAFYASFFYGIMTMYWSTAKDFLDLKKFRAKGLLKSQGITYNGALLTMTMIKIFYFTFTLGVPLLILPFGWGKILLGFLLMHFIAGLALALIFQPAHVIEETQFLMPNEAGKIENHWAIHQMKTTSNFAHESKLFSWYVGGLNYQVEHHLFPNICHIHYRNISKIVRETAKEYGVPYLQHKTWFGALRSHFTTLHQLGTGTYDKKLA